MKFDITGHGTWGIGFESWSALRPLLKSRAEIRPEGSPRPSPDLIPPRERRRAPIAVQLAVHVAAQACRDAQVDPARTASVFGLGMGDSQITDYLCRALLGDDKLISPTRFHNSVHNAASGYWSISVGCHAPATAVSAYLHTFPVALLEAAVQCTVEDRPVLLVVFDVPTPGPLHALTPIDEPFGIGLVLQPGSGFELSVNPGAVDWPELTVPALAELYTHNPAARGLALAQWLNRTGETLRLPLNAHQGLRLKHA